MNKNRGISTVSPKLQILFLRVSVGVLAFLLLPTLLQAQSVQSALCATPDALVSFSAGQGGGRGSDNMPANVLGLPDTVGRQSVPTIALEQVLSLGLEGEIVLRFDQVVIVDGPGVDFTVFENAFTYRTGGVDKIYAEPGEVAVSRDGVDYQAFPWNPETLEGCAGVAPTNGDQDPCNPALSGGDGFDLADLGIDSVRFIRIRDVTRTVLENKDHTFYDPTLNGFDLDAIVAVNTVPTGVSSVQATIAENKNTSVLSLQLLSGIASSSFQITLPRANAVDVRMFDLAGNPVGGSMQIHGVAGKNYGVLPTEGLSSGVYLVVATVEGVGRITEQLYLLR